MSLRAAGVMQQSVQSHLQSYLQGFVQSIMQDTADAIRRALSRGPTAAAALAATLGVSVATVSRRVAALGADVVRAQGGRAALLCLRDTRRGVPEVPVYRVGEDGRVSRLGLLVPVRPEGWVMQGEDGTAVHHEGLPWWIADMRPAGYLGRAYAGHHAVHLGLSPRLSEWSDTDHLRALLAHGHDAPGNLLLGDLARERQLSATWIARPDEGDVYAHLARTAAQGGEPGTSAGGEQPKFPAYVETDHGGAHVLCKFTAAEAGPVPQRWADLLLAEHHALETLRAAGIEAARSQVIDHDGRRFLRVERFDRVGPLGRRALLSLATLDAEFVGSATPLWPSSAARLAAAGVITREAAEGAALLHAFGTLIGNTDMHAGNLSFIGAGRPYGLAPAYDMLPMGLAPAAGGTLPDTLAAPYLRPEVPPAGWRRALGLAETFLARVRTDNRWSARWAPCIEALAVHHETARVRIGRLGD